MKATDPKNSPDPVSRPSNEEIEADKNGNLRSAREKYAGNDDHQPSSGIDNGQWDGKRKNQDDNLGEEDG